MWKFWKNSVLYFLWYKDQNVRWNQLLQLLALIRTKILRHEIPQHHVFGWRGDSISISLWNEDDRNVDGGTILLLYIRLSVHYFF